MRCGRGGAGQRVATGARSFVCRGRPARRGGPAIRRRAGEPAVRGRGAALAPEIALYEPADALFAGADGLDVIRRLLSHGRRRVGGRVGDRVRSGGCRRRRWSRAPGFASVERLRDLAGPRAGGRRAPVSASEAFERCMSVGGVAVFPADTVYGLACDPDDKVAVQRLYTLKRAVSRQALGGDVLRRRRSRLAALPELGERTREALCAADAGRGERAAAQPGGAVPAGVRRRPVDARVAGAGGAAAGGRALAGAAVERQPRGRPGSAPSRGRARAAFAARRTW